MNATRAKRGFTLVELIVVIVIIGIAMVILIPVLNAHWETERRATCMNNVGHQIGLAMHTYLSAYNRFPPSATVIKAPGDSTRTVGGWSFLVQLLPFLKQDSLFKTLPADGDPEDTSNQAIVAAMNTQLSEFVCPSGPRGSRWQASGALGITNYKAMGATTRDSLAMVVNPTAMSPYGPATIHPDGAIFPGTATRSFDIQDGMSHTIMMMETIDEVASRWTVGKEVTLVGMPQKSSPTGTVPQSPYNYFAPPGFVFGEWGSNSAVTKAGLRTFLAYDFSPRGADAGTYEDPGFAQTPPAYGPSSSHPGVVVCGMADASTQALSKQADAALLFFLITKNNSDPFYISIR